MNGDEPVSTREEALKAVQHILERLYATGTPLDELQEADHDHCVIATREQRTVCGECRRSVITAWQYGRFALCRTCATRRLELNTRLAKTDPAHHNDPGRIAA